MKFCWGLVAANMAVVATIYISASSTRISIDDAINFTLAHLLVTSLAAIGLSIANVVTKGENGAVSGLLRGALLSLGLVPLISVPMCLTLLTGG